MNISTENLNAAIFVDEFKNRLISNLRTETESAFDTARETAEDNYAEINDILVKFFDKFQITLEVKLTHAYWDSIEIYKETVKELEEIETEQKEEEGTANESC